MRLFEITSKLPLPATPENVAKAKAFVLKKWQERAAERSYEVADLSGSCKFSSLFAQRIFGGKLRGHEDHQYVVLKNETILDLNIDAKDVRGMVNPHRHNKRFWNNKDHRESMASCIPRVNAWVEEFQRTLTESSLELPSIEVGDEVMVGKFKNRKAVIKSFSKDDHNQPVLKTTKGDQKLFKPRIVKLMKEAIQRPRIFYRGIKPGDTRRIRTGDDYWDSKLFVSSDINGARAYGAHVTTYEALPDTKILYEGTQAFISVAKGLKPREMTFLDFSVEMVKRAANLGYDAVWFKRQADIGTVIINPNKFKKIERGTEEQLDQMLSLWGEGWSNKAWRTPKLHADLLALRDVASQWTDLYGASELYRAFMPTKEQLDSLKRNGSFVIKTPSDIPLVSWSATMDGAERWITGFDHPWVIIEKQGLDALINLGDYLHEHGKRDRFDEVIVKMPPQMVVTKRDIVQSSNIGSFG